MHNREMKIISGRFLWPEDHKTYPSESCYRQSRQASAQQKELKPARIFPTPTAHLTDWGKTALGTLTVLLDGTDMLTVEDIRQERFITLIMQLAN